MNFVFQFIKNTKWRIGYTDSGNNCWVSFEEVKEWGNKYCDAMVRYNIPTDQIESSFRSFIEMVKKNATEEEQGTMEQMMLEMRLHMKKKKEEDKAIKQDSNVLKVKLPKLVITTFKGTQVNWFRFWNHFKCEIDRSESSLQSQNFLTIRS